MKIKYYCHICNNEIHHPNQMSFDYEYDNKMAHSECIYKRELEEKEKELEEKYPNIDETIIDMLDENEELSNFEDYKWVFIYEDNETVHCRGASDLDTIKILMATTIKNLDGCPIHLYRNKEEVNFKIKIEVEGETENE